MNKQMMRELGFNEEIDRVEPGKCATCGKDMTDAKFKNEISRKEFKISGMCQECQDETFGIDDE